MLVLKQIFGGSLKITSENNIIFETKIASKIVRAVRDDNDG